MRLACVLDHSVIKAPVKDNELSTYSAQISDLTPEGVCIHSATSLPLGEKIVLFLTIPTSGASAKFKTFETVVEVVWSEKIKKSKQYRVGTHFVYMKKETREALNQFYASQTEPSA